MTVLEDCLPLARPGLALEFGVATGATLRVIADKRPGQTYGFDSFHGLPEKWRDGFNRGMFACPPPDVPGAHLIPGPYTDTLPDWFTHHPTPDVGFVHIDCDLYSSTTTVLTSLGRPEPGTVIVFDELVGYPGWEQHEHRALLEWVARTGVTLKPIAAHGEAVGFTVT